MRVGYRESLGRFELTFDFAESFLGRVSRGAARYPAKLWVKAVFMTLINISLFYQKNKLICHKLLALLHKFCRVSHCAYEKDFFSAQHSKPWPGDLRKLT